MDFQCVRTYITSCNEWTPNTRHNFGSEMPVRTVSQKFIRPQWGKIFKELWGRPTTTADFGSSFWQVPYTSNVYGATRWYRTVRIAQDGPQNAVQSMPIILEWRHRLLHMRASLSRNSGQSTFHCVYDGPSFNSIIRNQEGTTSWPQIWETTRRQRIPFGP